MNEPLAQVGRLALRHEGDNWNAYYALPGAMDGAIFLGSIRMGAVTTNPARKEAFMLMMRDIVADIIQENTGHRPTSHHMRPSRRGAKLNQPLPAV